MTPLHRPPESLYDQPIRVHLVGAGGNGSKMLAVLRALHFALIAVGHRFGLSVALYDFDRVSRANLVRQAFMPPDVGQYKALVLINRYNLAYGLQWTAHTTRYRVATKRDAAAAAAPHLLITAVDTRAARAEIAATVALAPPEYWLDLGNNHHTGQVVLGQPKTPHCSQRGRLPTAVELFPELTDASLDTDDGPSCSAAEALERQDLFVNDALAAAAGNLLWSLLRTGIRHHGVFIDTQSGFSRSLPIDGKLWNRLSRSNTKKRRVSPDSRTSRDVRSSTTVSRRAAGQPAAIP